MPHKWLGVYRLHKKPKKNRGAGASETSVYRVRIQLYMPKRDYRDKKIAVRIFLFWDLDSAAKYAHGNFSVC